MILGHLPAGYVLSKLSYYRFYNFVDSYRTYLFWGIFGSVAPDLDMFYFHFIDHRHTNHHKYVSHYPIVWVTLIAISLFMSKFTRVRHGIYVAIFSLSGFVHIILDSIVGDVWWFAPYVDHPFSIATVTARYHPWWINFIIHWSFFLEIMIFIWALWIWRSSSNPCSQADAVVCRIADVNRQL